MESSPVSGVTKKQDIDNNLQDDVKIVNKQPPSSGVQKSSKSVLPPKTNKLTVARAQNKSDVKNRLGVVQNSNQRDSSLARQKPTDSKISLNASTKTKIPAMQRPVAGNNKRTLVDVKTLAKPNGPPKDRQQKEISENKTPPKLKQNQIKRCSSKASICRSEPTQVKNSLSIYSKSNFVSTSQGRKPILRSQSVRSSSEMRIEGIDQNCADNLRAEYQALEDGQKLQKDLTDKLQVNMAKKNKEILELQKKSKIQENEINNLKTERDNLQKDLKSHNECLSTTNKKLQDRELQLKKEKNESKCKTEAMKKLENETIDCQKLETDLAEMTKQFKELQTKTDKETEMECEKHSNQITELMSQISCLEQENEGVKHQNKKLELEIFQLATVKETLLNSEKKVQELQSELDNMKKTVVDFSKEDKMELTKLRQSEADKQQEIENLKLDLSETQLNICQLEQHVQRNQQLLDVRSSLINSLQANEKTHQIHIEKLFAQVGEKNSTINELNCELQNKSEEYGNIFTKLSAKQMELANQVHIIKLLEENNERNQMLRVKQEEKIGKLEEELANLKQTIAFYQANVLAANSGAHLLSGPAANVNYNENFYYYISQRKRKRHIDINVKKYET